MVRLLLQAGARSDIGEVPAGKALHLACFLGNAEIIHLLLDNGAAVDAISGCYGRPLFAAIAGVHPYAVKVLLERGSDPNLAHETPWKTSSLSVTQSQTPLEAIIGTCSSDLLQVFLGSAQRLRISEEELITAAQADARDIPQEMPYTRGISPER